MDLAPLSNDIRERLQETARMVATRLPPGTGFFLLAFDFGPDGRMEYIANAKRQDIVRTMREFIRKSEQDFMVHSKDDLRMTDEELVNELKKKVEHLERDPRIGQTDEERTARKAIADRYSKCCQILSTP